MSSSQEFDERAHLLVAAVEGPLTEEQCRRLEALLAADLDARRRYVDHLLLDEMLAERHGQDGVAGVVDLLGAEDASANGPRRGRSFRLGGWVLALAASVAVGSAVVWWFSRAADGARPNAGPTLVVESEGLEMVAVAGEAAPLAEGQVIQPGQAVRTSGAGGFAVIAHAEVRLGLSGDTTVRLAADPAAAGQVFLSQGAVRIESQGASQFTAVATPHALVQFSAASLFTCSTTVDATYVEVESGAVRVVRQADGVPVEVADGFATVVSAEAGERLAARPVPARPLQPAVVLKTPAVNQMAFVRDGTTLMTLVRGQLFAWDVATGNGKRIGQFADLDCRAAALSPDGSVFAGPGRKNVVRVLDTADLRERLSFTAGGRGTGAWTLAWGMALSFDGSRLALAESQEKHRMAVTVREVHPGAAPVKFAAGAWPARVLALSPDGKLAAIGTNEGEIVAWDAANGREVGRWQLSGAVPALVFSPDGQRLAAASGSGTVAVWDTATRAEVWRTRAAGRSFRSLAFAPNGSLLAAGTADGTVEVWHAENGGDYLSLQGPAADAVAALAFTHDSRTLAAAVKRSVLLWKLPEATLKAETR